jgi:SAM-dependent methyltransferase
VLHRLRLAVKPLVPVSLHAAAKRIALFWARLALAGDRVSCPCCGRSFRRFLRYPALFCPGCSSYERHRFLCLVLDRRPELLAARRGVLHVGPEPCIRRRVERRVGEYVSIDLDPRRAMRAMDVTALDFPDGRFDLALCSHVLDEVTDRDRALSELRRVLRPRGLALFGTAVPLQPELEERLQRAGFSVEALVAGDLDAATVERYGLIPDERLYLATA